MSVILGIQISAQPVSFVTVNASTNNQRAIHTTVFVPIDPLFVTHLGMWMRRGGSDNSKVQFAVWAPSDVNPNVPGARLGYTGTVTVTGGPSSAGANYEAAIVSTDVDGTAGTALRLLPGQKYFFGFEVQTAGMDYGRGDVATTHYRRSVGGGNPTNPFGTASTSNELTPALYAVCETNTAPVVTMTAPPAGTSNVTPTIAGTVTDAESASPLRDRMARLWIQVRHASTSVLVWDTGWLVATTAERTAGAFTRIYAGTTLIPGETYEARAQAEDDVGGVSDWATWSSFEIFFGGMVDVSASTPLGKQETGIITPWTARWTHATALAMNAAEIRLLVGGVVQKTSPTITKAAADNAIFSLSNTEATFATALAPLPPGQYTYQVRGRSSDSVWSPWSDAVAFSVNSPPNQPSNLRPVSGVTVSARPRLEWNLSDPDLDDVLGIGLISEVEITVPGGSISSFQTSNVDPSFGNGYFQLTATEAPTNGAYTWRVRGYDSSATLFGPWSAPATFTLVTAPIVTITSPVDRSTISTGTPQIAFSVTDGTISRYRANLYRAGATLPFFQSEWISVVGTVTDGIFPVPAGWLHNATIYEATITIETPTALSATSPRVQFTTLYPDADGVAAFQISPLQNDRDVEATSVLLSWDRTGYADFAGYVIWRRGADDDPAEAVPIRLIKSPGQTTFIDHHPPPNEALIYGATQLRRVGADIRSSPIVEAEIEVPLTVPVLVSMTRGATIRTPLKWLSTGLSGGFEAPDAEAATWGTRGIPTSLSAPEGYGAETMAVKFTIRGDQWGTLAEHFAGVRDVLKSGDDFELRQERWRLFCRLVRRGNWWSRGDVPGTIDITLSVKEIAWQEAIVIDT